MSDIIDLEKCPHCKEEYILSDKELACETCLPFYELDINLLEIAEGISNIEKLDSSLLASRKNVLINFGKRLSFILQKIV